MGLIFNPSAWRFTTVKHKGLSKKERRTIVSVLPKSCRLKKKKDAFRDCLRVIVENAAGYRLKKEKKKCPARALLSGF